MSSLWWWMWPVTDWRQGDMETKNNVNHVLDTATNEIITRQCWTVVILLRHYKNIKPLASPSLFLAPDLPWIKQMLVFICLPTTTDKLDNNSTQQLKYLVSQEWIVVGVVFRPIMVKPFFPPNAVAPLVPSVYHVEIIPMYLETPT